MDFHTYILYSPSFNKLYVGYTSNLERRIVSHNVLAPKGWTVKFRPWIVVYIQRFSTKSEAMKRELELKTAKGRKFIRETLIK